MTVPTQSADYVRQEIILAITYPLNERWNERTAESVRRQLIHAVEDCVSNYFMVPSWDPVVEEWMPVGPEHSDGVVTDG